jgi:hypothetical protein
MVMANGSRRKFKVQKSWVNRMNDRTVVLQKVNRGLPSLQEALGAVINDLPNVMLTKHDSP